MLSTQHAQSLSEYISMMLKIMRIRVHHNIVYSVFNISNNLFGSLKCMNLECILTVNKMYGQVAVRYIKQLVRLL